MQNGSCLCGPVAFTMDRGLSPPTVCHCGQCREQSGNVWASTWTYRDNLSFAASDPLRRYRASNITRNGFCGTSGAFLFWRQNDVDTFSISTGAFDEPIGLKLSRYVFVADKGDCHDILDDRPHGAQ